MSFIDKLKKLFKKNEVKALPAANIQSQETTSNTMHNQRKEYVDYIKKSAEQNLTPEQLKKEFIKSLDLDKKLIGIPVVEDTLMNALKNYDFKTKADIEKNKEFLQVHDGNNITFSNDYKDKNIFIKYNPNEKNISIITFNSWTESSISSITDPFSSENKKNIYQNIQSSTYDIDTNIEIARVIQNRKNGTISDSKAFERAEGKLNIVNVFDSDMKTIESKIDLTESPKDIATLDGVEQNDLSTRFYIDNLNNRLVHEYGFGATKSDIDKFDKKILDEKISQSKYKAGCYKYMGIEDPSINQGIDK